MTWSVARGLMTVCLFASVTLIASAQQPPTTGVRSASRTQDGTSSMSPKPEKTFELLPGEDPQNRLVSPFLSHLAGDQKQFWTSPTRLRKKDLRWIVPFGGITAGFIAGDSWVSKQVPDKPNQLDRSLKISDYTTYALLGAGGGAFLLGHMTHNDHMGETGLLAGEAAINSTAVTYLFKTATQRPRPLQDSGNGTFFKGGAAFTSEHSAIAWSIASVLAHEYPGPLTKLLAYGMASAVTMTRVTAKQHFPSDALIGSALGWYFGWQVYRAHHDPELGGTAWGNFDDTPAEKGPRDPANMSSPDVPPDSWVYPAFERLQALGVHLLRTRSTLLLRISLSAGFGLAVFSIIYFLARWSGFLHLWAIDAAVCALLLIALTRKHRISAAPNVEAPDQAGIGLKSARRSHILDALAFPQAAGATKGRQAAFGGDAGA